MGKSVFEMSDEEIMGLEDDAFDGVVDEEVADTPDEEEEEETSEDEPEDQESESAEEEASDEESEDEAEAESDETPEEEASEEGKTGDEKPVEKTSSDVDYQAVYARIMETPIRANGKEIKLQSVDEAVSLIQMGANYTKKMAELKPNLKILKTLKTHNLLDESKLSYLIDLSNNNPDAIAKLLSDSKIDPLDIDTSKAESYKTTVQTATDQEVVLEEVLADLRESDHFGKLSEVVTKQWDVKSRQSVYQQPEFLKRLHDHMVPNAEGQSIFDYVSAEVERRKVLGLVNAGASDYDTYISVGNELFEQAKTQQAPATVGERRVIKPASKPASVVDPQLVKKQKQAASMAPKGKPVKQDMDFNPLDMSDEEFEKFEKANRY